MAEDAAAEEIMTFVERKMIIAEEDAEEDAVIYSGSK